MSRPGALLKDVLICTVFGWVARGWWERQLEVRAFQTELKRASAQLRTSIAAERARRGE